MVERGVPLVILVLGGLYLSQAITLPSGTLARPGAGWYPTVVAVFACVVAFVATVQAFRTPLPVRLPGEAEPGVAGGRRRVASTVLALVAFCFVLPAIGYPIAAFAFVTAMLAGLGSRWLVAAGIALFAAAASHYLFAVLLDVPLPRGPW